MERGYVDFAWFADLNRQGVFFVTRRRSMWTGGTGRWAKAARRNRISKPAPLNVLMKRIAGDARAGALRLSPAMSGLEPRPHRCPPFAMSSEPEESPVVSMSG